jgi:Concanavalin A-like lectin/glucanases superfamily
MRIRASLMTLSGVLAVGALAAASTTPAAAATVVALWHMDEASGATTMVDSAGSNNGSLNNVQTGLTSCHAVRCYRFQGSPSVAVVPHSTTLNPGSSNITISMWVNTGVVPPPEVGDYDMVRKGLGDTPGGDYKMEVLPRKQGTVAKLYCYFRGSSGSAQLIRGPNLADNKWHSLQCTKTGSSIQAVVDGRTWTKSVTVGSIANTSDVTVGARSPLGGDQYQGIMDEVSISIG